MVLTAQTNRLKDRLAGLGFTKARGGEGYRHNGTLFTSDGAWSTLRTVQPIARAEPLHGLLGTPGLWKYVRGDGGGVVRIFDLPPAAQIVAEDAGDDEEASPIKACLAWALATADGTVPEGWQPPPRAEVEAWIPAGGLTVQTGPLVRQGELIHRPDRLALVFPLVARVPEELSAARREWLGEVLTDAQNRWRMVRIGLTDDAEPRALAEVDLSGCPHGVLESVFQAGLGALRWVVEWLVRSAAFLADPVMVCRALEVCRVRV